MIELKQVTKQYGQATVLKTLPFRLANRVSIACLAGMARAKQRFSNPSPGIRILQAARFKLTVRP